MTTQPSATVCDVISFPNGLEFDLDEGWRKLVSRQFRGSPGRGFAELIQNMLDSYPAGTDFADRVARIETEPQSIVITDWGDGLSALRLKLLTTLGGTDKENDASKIGRFGIGFFSIFHPGLDTRSVRVVT